MAWNIDYTLFDQLIKNGKDNALLEYQRERGSGYSSWPSDPNRFYLETIEMHAYTRRAIETGEINLPAEQREYIHDGTKVWSLDCVSEWLYIKLGRPRWLIGADLLKLLCSCKLDDDLSGVVFTHDVVTLVFDDGASLNGIPLQWIRVCAIKSKLSRKMVLNFFHKEAVDEKIFDMLNFTICFRAAVNRSDKITLDENSWTPHGIGFAAESVWREYGAEKFFLYNSKSDAAYDGKTITGSAVAELVKQGIKIAAAAMVYQHARPDLVVPFTLSRSERYKQHGERGNISHVRLPQKLGGFKPVVGDHQTASSGRVMSPHYRGFVLAVLRDPRFKRRLDGSFNTVLRQPCGIHTELIAETDAK